MQLRKAIIASLLLHVVLIVMVSFFAHFIGLLPHKKIESFEAKVIFKGKPRDKEFLPRKKSIPVNSHKQLLKNEEKNKVAPKPTVKTLPVKKESLIKTASSNTSNKKNYADALKKLSARFSEDVASVKQDVAPDDFSEQDASYFDEIYALIKESFIVPPHVNGPEGHKLQATIRLFLLHDGTLARVDLEHPSGDEHFDKAVLDGTKRVANFGRPPIMLQNALSEQGIAVDMCPFKCERKD